MRSTLMKRACVIVVAVGFVLVANFVVVKWCGGIKDGQVSIAESLAAFTTALVAVIGALCAYYKWDEDQMTRKAELLRLLLTQFDDEKVQKLYSAVEDGHDIESVLKRSPNDCNVTLRFFSYLCYALRVGLIGKDQFDFFSFQIRRVTQHPLVWAHLMGFTDTMKYNSPSGPYYDLVEKARKMKWYPEEEGQYYDEDEGCPSEDQEHSAFVDETMFLEPTIVIRINRLYKEGMSEDDLYKVTRGDWRVNYYAVKKAKIALSVANRIVREVYSITGWEREDGAAIGGANEDLSFRRLRFIGKRAPEEVRVKFIGKSTSHLFSQGDAYPVRYFGFENVKGVR